MSSGNCSYPYGRTSVLRALVAAIAEIVRPIRRLPGGCARWPVLASAVKTSSEFSDDRWELDIVLTFENMGTTPKFGAITLGSPVPELRKTFGALATLLLTINGCPPTVL